MILSRSHSRTGARRLLGALLALSLIGLWVTATAQDSASQISLQSETYIVSVVTGDDGQPQERFSAATSALPGQVVEFRIVATNIDATTLPAGQVQIIGPVPDGMVYVAGSATLGSDQVYTEFSVDGVEFVEQGQNVFVTEGGNRRIADPSEYRVVRWTLTTDMEPGQEVTLVYRVRLVD